MYFFFHFVSFHSLWPIYDTIFAHIYSFPYCTRTDVDKCESFYLFRSPTSNREKKCRNIIGFQVYTLFALLETNGVWIITNGVFGSMYSTIVCTTIVKKIAQKYLTAWDNMFIIRIHSIKFVANLLYVPHSWVSNGKRKKPAMPKDQVLLVCLYTPVPWILNQTSCVCDNNNYKIQKKNLR